jgi:isopenicillin N synthase-like dioxygenase
MPPVSSRRQAGESYGGGHSRGRKMKIVTNNGFETKASNSIPVIDFQPFISGDTDTQKAVATNLYRAIEEVGCFYLSGAVSATEVGQVFTQSQYFFGLPQSEKEQLLLPSDGSFHGYIVTSIAAKTINEKLSLTQEILQNPMDAAPDGRSQWFQQHPEFCDCIWQAYQSLRETVKAVLGALAIALDAPKDYFIQCHSQHNDSMLLLHYPALCSTPESTALRHEEHSDLGSITLLFQEQVGGLEICTQTGDWIPVPPLTATPLILLGNLISRWTNDEFPATRHRVSLLTAGQVTQDRYSFGLFAAPDENAEIVCLETCLAPNEKPKYPPIRTHEYYRQKFEAKQKS